MASVSVLEGYVRGTGLCPKQYTHAFRTYSCWLRKGISGLEDLITDFAPVGVW
jgi:hypothetical protein